MAAIVILCGLAALLVFAAFGWRWGGGEWDRHFAMAESLLAIAGLLGAGAWYFIARPDAPKLKIEQSVQGISVDQNRALILHELSLSNVGGRSLNLKHVTYKIFVNQVTPMTEPLLGEYQPQSDRNSPRTLHSGDSDRWVGIARLEGSVDSNIEGGEIENLYNRVILPCNPNLRVYISSWVYRPRTMIEKVLGEEQLGWGKQTLLDLSEECKKGAKTNAKTSDSRAAVRGPRVVH